MLATSALIIPSSAIAQTSPLAPGALPSGGTITAGSAAITRPNTNTLQITQSSDKAVIDWRSYSIGSQAWVNYTMPNSSAVSLNRATGGDVSYIFGKLTANGNVMLINPNGIVFGKGAVVDVAGLVATTANITNSDFMAGRMRFTTPGKPNAVVLNEGTITVREAGIAAFVAPRIENRGVIEARLGSVSLAAGNTFTLDLYGDGLVRLAVTDPVTVAALGEGQPLVKNSGTIRADGGRVLITAAAAKGVVDTVINMDGVVQARSVSQTADGTIVLDGGDNGAVRVAGTVDVSSNVPHAPAGKVTITGERVRLVSTARIDATAQSGRGGTVKIGGDYQGRGATRQAKIVTIDAGALINASAVDSGDGGTVVVWSTGTTTFNGTIMAKGGVLHGNGGLVETSGHALIVGDSASVSTLAPGGNTGNWLLDPTTINIATGGANGIGCALVTCTISPATLQGALAGSNVTLQANSAINFNNNVVYVGLNTLTLDIGTPAAAGTLGIGNGVSVTLGNLVLTSPRQGNNTGITINYLGASATDGFLNVTNLTLVTDAAISGGPAAWRGTQPTTVNVLKHPSNPLGTDVPVASEPQGGQLADGVAFAAAGGVLNVGPGTFLLPATLTINKALTLRGNNFGIDPVTAPGSRLAETVITRASNQTMISVTASNVTLDGFSFDGDSAGANNPANFAATAISGANVDNLSVRNSIFRRLRTAGVSLNNTGSTVTTGLTIAANTFTSIDRTFANANSAAILLQNRVYGSVTGNRIDASDGAVNNGIRVVTYTTGAVGSLDIGGAVAGQGNIITGVGRNAIELNNLGSGRTFSILGNTIDGSATATGLLLQNVSGTVNVANGTAIANTATGVRIVDTTGTQTGTFTFDATTSVTSTTTAAFEVVRTGGTSTPTVNFAGAISIAGGRLLNLTGQSGGTITIAPTLLTATGGTGINISNSNAAITINDAAITSAGAAAVTIGGTGTSALTFNNLDIANATSDGFVVSTSQARTITLGSGSTVVTTTGAPVRIVPTAATTLDMTWDSIASNGAANAIRLQNTAGSFVANAGSNATTGTAVLITNMNGTVTLNGLTFTSAGDGIRASVSGNGITTSLILGAVSLDLTTAGTSGLLLQNTSSSSGAIFLDLQLGNRFAGGAEGIVLSGPRIALVGDTFGDTVLTGQSLNYIRLDQGALFAPGNPSIIDIGAVDFDGVVLGPSPSNAMKAALEPKIVHFLDNGNSGLFGQLVPNSSPPAAPHSSPPAAPQVQSDLNLPETDVCEHGSNQGKLYAGAGCRLSLP